MGLSSCGQLITFKDDNSSNTSETHRADKYLDLNFSYLNVIKHQVGIDRTRCLIITCNTTYYIVENMEIEDRDDNIDTDSSSFKDWVKALTKFTVRIDKPCNFRIIS